MKPSLKAFVLILVFSLTAFAQTALEERDKGIELFKQGNYKAAAEALKDFTKQNPSDYLAFHYLGLALTRENKFKDAEKAYEKAIRLNPNFADSQAGLAYIYLLRNKLSDAVGAAEKAAALDAGNAEIFYLLGSAYLRLGDAEAAFKHAERAIKLNPNMADLYLLKAQAVMNISFADRNETPPREDRYGIASDSIGKFIILSKNSPDSAFWRGQQEALQFYAAYYAEREKNKSAAGTVQENVLKTPVKILSKRRANYTDRARQAGAFGVVRLLVAFAADGSVKHIIALNSLGYGLEQEAIEAAKDIKFEPEKIDGKPVTAVKSIEYSFMLY